jgi:flagellar basal body-associated protein FliL
MSKIIIIVVVTAVCIAIGTLIRYFTRTGVFKGRKNKDSKNNPGKN